MSEPKPQIAVRLDPDDHQVFTRISGDLGVSNAWLLRRVVDLFLARYRGGEEQLRLDLGLDLSGRGGGGV